MNKKFVTLMLILFILPISGCMNKVEEVNEVELIGGDRDEHGCIGSAGYTWCESKQKCLRVWEEDCIDLVESEEEPVK